MSDEAHPHEIIIIKRHGGGHEEGHHGGAWKIAYADFVTAMMAFFLVMWLISANDKTKAVIARYFNPVQLVDSTPQPPGLNDPRPDAPNVPQKTGGKPVPDAKESKDAARDAKPAEKPRKDEADLFKNPEETLSEIVSKDGVSPRPPARVASDNPRNGVTTSDAAGQKGGEAFRDPFEPQAAVVQDATAEVAPVPAPARIDGATPPSSPARSLADLPPDVATAPLPAEPRAKAAELKNRIDAVMKTIASAGTGPKVDVKATAEGLLIALTDDAKFSMFASASAEPSPRTVMLMERVGKLLKAQKGKVTIRGFTDSHKFKSDTYDNWRLSSARAHMAHYMLARGGLEDARIERIEGYADHQPRNAKDPEGPENRRIEILLREAS